MSKFVITKKISLAEVLGKGHEQDVLCFKPMTFKDAKDLEGLQPAETPAPVLPDNATAAQKAAYEKEVAEHKAAQTKAALEAVDKAVEFIKGKFVSGKVTDEATGKLVEVEADDLTNGNLGVDVANYCMAQLAGGQPEGFTKG